MYKQNFVAVVKCNGSILREREGGTVYLPFGSNYSILLKNKHVRKASVGIEVDGKDVLNGHKLIMEPNSTEEIKGFMRDMSKTNRFKFINKTKQIQRHRGDRIDDGLVRVTYRFEKAPEPIVRHSYISDRDNPWDYSGSAGRWGGNTVSCYFSNSSSGPVGAMKCSSTPRTDEGITVNGEKINQGYEYGHIGTLESASNVIVLQLKGRTKTRKKVVKSVTVRTKIICSTCGKRNRSHHKYCSRCGTYLD
jgi:ribosomal protein L32